MAAETTGRKLLGEVEGVGLDEVSFAEASLVQLLILHVWVGCGCFWRTAVEPNVG